MQILLFGFTFFTSALLVFSVQPMVGKMMLPFVGGSPAGWVVAMAFFQIALLGGYTLAWVGSRLNAFTQALFMFAMLGVGFVSLPILFDDHYLQAGITPYTVLIQLMFVCVLPFMALSTIAPGLQRIFSYSGHETSHDPYYLYAASNMGSFLGLLAYPLVVEPLVGLDAQSMLWMAGYCGLIALLALCCAWVFLRTPSLISLGLNTDDKAAKDVSKAERPSWAVRGKWLILAAVPSSLVLGVTTEITTDLASLPMLWVIPLALYLATHILAFGKAQWVHSPILPYMHLFMVAIVLFSKVVFAHSAAMIYMFGALMLAFLVCFFLTCLVLHRELVKLRPHVKYLTEFYFFLSLGGAIGGSFNAFLAPIIFENQYEFLGALILSVVLSPLFVWTKDPKVLIKALLIGGGIVVLSAATYFASKIMQTDAGPVMSLLGIAIFFGLCVSLVRPIYLASAGAMIVILLSVVIPQKEHLYSTRNFFGVSIVKDRAAEDRIWEKDYALREYFHGSTLHGFQVREGERETLPLAYYGLGTSLDSAFAVTKPKNVMVIGLGVGTMACFNQLYKDAKISFIEIDQAVKDIALEYFTYLDRCGYEDIAIEDGRLYFQKRAMDAPKYDLLIIDAFSSDVVPMHLLTEEAFTLYRQHLSDDGMIILNISNRYFDLSRPLDRVAKALDMDFFAHYNLDITDDELLLESLWAVLANKGQYDDELTKAGWLTLPDANGPLWTDQFSNLVSVMSPLSLDNLAYITDKGGDTQIQMHRYVLKHRKRTAFDDELFDRYTELKRQADELEAQGLLNPED